MLWTHENSRIEVVYLRRVLCCLFDLYLRANSNCFPPSLGKQYVSEGLLEHDDDLLHCSIADLRYLLLSI